MGLPGAYAQCSRATLVRPLVQSCLLPSLATLHLQTTDLKGELPALSQAHSHVACCKPLARTCLKAMHIGQWDLR